MSSPDEFVDYCYHEAAHAVFYHHAGLELVELYVRGEGKIRVEWPNHPSPQQALDLAAGCLAGSLSWYTLHGEKLAPMPFDDFMQTADFAIATAQMMEDMGFTVDPEQIRASIPEDVGDDYGDALDMLQVAESLCGELETCYEAALEKVRSGLQEWWPEIRTVAIELMNEKYLSGSRATQIMEAAKRR